MKRLTVSGKIYYYIAFRLLNPEAASAQSDRIMSAAEILAAFPKIFRVRGKDSDGNELRLFPVDNYAVLYSVDEASYTVNVSNVIYGKRNLEEII